MSDNAGFDTDRLNRWSDPVEFKVEHDHIIAYAEATNDPIPDHRNGTIAPPVFAAVPGITQMADSTMSVVPDNLMLRILHGKHDFHFHRPIRPGEVLQIRAKPTGIKGKASGVIVTTVLETRSNAGDLINEQYFTGFFRGGQFDGLVGTGSPQHAFPAEVLQRAPDHLVTQRFDEDQTFRYAEPALDPMAVHLDDDFAKQMGLPGIIIHGLCTMAFVSHALVTHVNRDGADSSALKRLAVRFSSPARPRESIETAMWNAGRHDDRDVYVFQTRGDEKPEKFVLKDGRAEFA